MTTTIGIIGCAGRMGQTLVQEVLRHPNCTLAGGVEYTGHPMMGKDIGMLVGAEGIGLTVGDDVQALVKAADAVIDFTSPASTLKVAQIAAKERTAHIIGTTGLSDAETRELEALAKQTVIMKSSNMSIGVNVLFALVEQVAGMLDESYDIEIVEMHHRHKVDAPSGTALSLGEAAARGRAIALNDVAVKSRDGITGARQNGTIGFATLRGGDVVGDHTVMFATEGERVELTHKASSRAVFAKGAVRAAIWTKGQRPGRIYSMRDVLMNDRVQSSESGVQ